MKSTRSAVLAAFWLLSITSTVEAHTWLENVMLIGSNGSFVGNPGYPRGYGPRTGPQDPNAANVYQLPPAGVGAFLPSHLMCKPTQIISNYTPGYGPLTAAPQDHIALRYLENGHVTKDVGQTRPAHNGTIFVYGTKKPANTDTYVGIHRVWNTEGTGGDKRGKLIATRTYDDGRCFQVNKQPLSDARKAAINWPDGGDLICQTDVQIPADAGTSGNYTLYWVWEWPQLDPKTGAITANESYTSCLDITLTGQSTTQTQGKFADQKISGLNAGFVAIEAQLGSQFLVDPTATPQVKEGPPFTMSSTPASSTAAPPASSNAPASSKPTTHAPAATSASASNGFVTVTITESAHDTVTVTVIRDATSQATAPTSVISHTASNPASVTVSTHTETVIPLPTSTASSSFITSAAVPPATTSSVHVSPSGVPTPKPFLDSKGNVIPGGAARLRVRGGWRRL